MVRQNNRKKMKSNDILQVVEEMNMTIDKFKEETMHLRFDTYILREDVGKYGDDAKEALSKEGLGT